MQHDFKLCFCLCRAQRTNLLERSFDEATAVAADAGARDQIQKKKGHLGDKHQNTQIIIIQIVMGIGIWK